jgi:hypothetical protein
VAIALDVKPNRWMDGAQNHVLALELGERRGEGLSEPSAKDTWRRRWVLLEQPGGPTVACNGNPDVLQRVPSAAM